MNPAVSIILPVYNYGHYIGTAINSILNQSFEKWELLVINDGSTDNSQEVIQGFKDLRVKLYNRSHRGLVSSSNFGMKKSRGKYVIRMDADDVMLPERLETQVNYMEKNPKVAVLGSNVVKVNDDNVITGFIKYPGENEKIRKILRRRNTLCHSSTLIRKEVIQKIDYYDEEFKYTHDYELWLRIPGEYKIINLNKFLHAWRWNEEGISRKKETVQLKFVIKAKIKAIKNKNIPVRSGFFILKDIFVLIFPKFVKNFIRKNIIQKIKTRRTLNSVEEKWKIKLNQKLQL